MMIEIAKMIGRLTSRQARAMARVFDSSGAALRSTRSMFSTITIAPSTIAPMAIAIPPRLMMFALTPLVRITMKEMRIPIGSVAIATRTRLRRWKWPAAAAAAIVVAMLAGGHFGVFPIRGPGPDVAPVADDALIEFGKSSV